MGEFFKRLKNMSQKNVARHLDCPMPIESAVIAADSSASNVPTQKRKKDAEQILYLNRI